MWKLLARLLRRDRHKKQPPPEPRRRRHRDPHEPLHYDDGSPAQRWLYGLDEPQRHDAPDQNDE